MLEGNFGKFTPEDVAYEDSKRRTRKLIEDFKNTGNPRLRADMKPVLDAAIGEHLIKMHIRDIQNAIDTYRDSTQPDVTNN